MDVLKREAEACCKGWAAVLQVPAVSSLTTQHSTIYSNVHRGPHLSSNTLVSRLQRGASGVTTASCGTPRPTMQLKSAKMLGKKRATRSA